MTSELREFAARLRDTISVYSSEFGCETSASVPAMAAHNDAEFNAMALVLFALQFQANDGYRTICEAKRISPEKISHWTQIPAVPASAFKELELSCLSAHERTAVFHSSGTTGHQPSRHFHCPESLSIYEASLWPWFRTHVFGDTEPHSNGALVILTPPPVQAPHSSLVHMFEVVRHRFGAPESVFIAQAGDDGAWNLSIERVCHVLANAESKALELKLLGTAFSFVHLSDLLRERNLRFALPAGSRVMETGGYKGRSRELPRSELHALISERLGIPSTHIVCEYGMSELSSQAYDRCVAAPNRQNSERVFQFPPWARARVISPETGLEVAEDETGLLRIHDLANVFSVMAVQTQDLAIRRGNGFELLGRAERAELRGCSLMNAELETAINIGSRS